MSHTGRHAALPERFQSGMPVSTEQDQVSADLFGGLGNYRGRVAARNFSCGGQALFLELIKVSLEVFESNLFGDVEVSGGGGGKHVADGSLLTRKRAQGGDDAQQV